jgi:outer membrane immunogenic protein
MRKLVMLGAVVSLVAIAQPSLGADIPVKAPVAVPAVHSWSGAYLGVVAGWGAADSIHTNVNNGLNSDISRIRGGLLGGTYGFNWQISSWVIGFEGDFSASRVKGQFVSRNNPFFCGVGFPCVTDLRWFGTNRARLGYAWDRLLFFGTAGIAYGKVRGTLLFPGFTTGETTRTGFVYGGGLEVALSQGWSVKAEYLHTDLGDKLTYGNPVPVESVSFKRFNIVRGGLNYNFNWPRW